MVRVLSTGVAPTVIVSARQVPWWLRGSPARILYLDDFEGVLKWDQGSGTVERANDVETFEGAYSLKLTTGAVVANMAQARKFLGYPGRSKMALQLRWHGKNSAETTLRSFYAMVDLYDGAKRYAAGVLYLQNQTTPQNLWEYLAPGLAWTPIPDASEVLTSVMSAHHYLRWVIDFSVDPPVYVSLETPKLNLKPAGLVGYSTADAGAPRLQLQVSEITDAALASVLYADALCLSDQEP